MEKAEELLNGYREEMREKPEAICGLAAEWHCNVGGVRSLIRLADLFPMLVKRAKGARIWVADDNEHLDFMLDFSAMILGNAPEEVEEAIREAVPRGIHYRQCHKHAYAFAKPFCDMVPASDCSSARMGCTSRRIVGS